jgi:hypothetical protein
MALDSKRMIAGFTMLRSAFQQSFRQASSVTSPVPRSLTLASCDRNASPLNLW